MAVPPIRSPFGQDVFDDPSTNGAAAPEVELRTGCCHDRSRVVEELHLSCDSRSRSGVAEELLDDTSVLEGLFLKRWEHEEQAAVPLLHPGFQPPP